MKEPGYAYTRYPWPTAIGLRSPAPGRLYADLVRQWMRYGAPVAGRAARFRRALGRRPPPKPVLGAGVRALPRRRRPDLDRIALDLFAAWPRLIAPLGGEPAEPDLVDLLALERSSALTVFVFPGGKEPVFVAKVPHASGALEREVSALQLAAGGAGAPLYLGMCGDAHVQEAIRGRAVRVEALSPEACSGLPFTANHRALFEALVELKIRTKTRVPPSEAHPERAREALAHPGLPSQVADVVRAALERVEALEVSVLKHGDLSPQNCLFDERGFSGIVDWEHSTPHGTPGFDTLNAAAAEVEHRLALQGPPPETYGEALADAWYRSPFFAGIRDCVRSEVEGVGGSLEDADAVAVAFFARRLGHRIANPERYASDVDAARATLIRVCS